MYFECLYQIRFDLSVNSWTASSSKSLSIRCNDLIFLIASISSKINLSYSLLFLVLVCHLSGINFSMIEMLTVNRV